jgi:hypothetical protein
VAGWLIHREALLTGDVWVDAKPLHAEERGQGPRLAPDGPAEIRAHPRCANFAASLAAGRRLFGGLELRGSCGLTFRTPAPISLPPGGATRARSPRRPERTPRCGAPGV